MNSQKKNILYLKRGQIDSVKWDLCIDRAVNSLIYAKTFYLDAMSVNWHALVLEDYSMVMPLTWKSKFTIKYLYQPPFTAQLGVFFSDPADVENIPLMVGAAKNYFRFAEIQMNFLNQINGSVSRSNFILNLNKSHEELRHSYKRRLHENLKEAESFNLQYGVNHDHTVTIDLFKRQYGQRFLHVRNQDYLNFKRLCDLLLAKNLLMIREVRDSSDELLASSIFFRDQQRIYNIMSLSLPAGREKRAHFFLLDQLIGEFSSNNLILDFEGSEVPGIAEFYKKFGSMNQPCFFLRYNLLPFPVRLFK